MNAIRRPLLLLAAIPLLITACLGEGGGGGGEGGGGEGGGGGDSVTVFGAFTQPNEVEPFEAAMAEAEEELGISIQYEGSREFETLITTRVQGGNPPDIALFPQPGLLLDVAESAEVTPLDEYLDLAAVEEALVPGILEAGKAEDGTAYGLPVAMGVKSVLLYPVPEFEEAGYAVPTTQAELAALEQQIKDDGGTPWCMGMEAGDATGWVGTDWIEEYMLRVNGPEVYDQWVNHEIPFDAPEVRAAFEAFGERWQTEGNVLGGAQGMLSIPYGDTANAMFEDPPGCWLHRQGSFIASFFPEDVQADLENNVAAAYFPPDEEGFDGSPVLISGDLAMMLNDTEPARQLMEFMSTPEFGGPWVEGGGVISPKVDFDASQYPNDLLRTAAEIGTGADVVRFDGSDLMPGAVGAGSFWSGIVDWVGGQKDLNETVTGIEQSWPADG